MKKLNEFSLLFSIYSQSKTLYLDEPNQKKPNSRKLIEQPGQQTKEKMWYEVADSSVSSILLS